MPRQRDAVTILADHETAIRQMRATLARVGSATFTLEALDDTTLDVPPATGDVLQYTGATWENQTLAEAGISAVGHTHLEADITDLGDYVLTTGDDMTGELHITVADGVDALNINHGEHQGNTHIGYQDGGHYFSIDDDALLRIRTYNGTVYTTLAEFDAGQATITTPLHLSNTEDVSGTAGTGVLVIGDLAGEHVAFDGNEVQAWDNGTPTAGDWHLLLNGGTLFIGQSAAGIKVQINGTTDDLEIGSTADDFYILNNQQDNGIWIYDGTGGIELHYNGLKTLEIDGTRVNLDTSPTGGVLRVDTGSGYIDIGPQNTSFAHIYTDRSTFALNAAIAMVSSDTIGTSTYPGTALWLESNPNVEFGNNDAIRFNDSTNIFFFEADGGDTVEIHHNSGTTESIRLLDGQGDNHVVWTNNPYTNGSGDYTAYWDNDIDGTNVGWAITTTLSSGRAIKTDIKDYQEDEVGAAFLRIPMRSWKYDEAQIRHNFPSRGGRLDGHVPKDNDGDTRHWYVAEEVEEHLPWMVGQPDGDPVKRIKDGRPWQVAVHATLRHLDRRLRALEEAA